MAWKVISILAVICHLAVTVYGGLVGGVSSSHSEEKASRLPASVVFCHSDQTFFCVNLTHYSPCIHLELLDLRDPTSVNSQEREFYCGAQRCCQVGADSPCTYRCQRPALDFEEARIMWKFPTKKKKKKSQDLDTSEEAERLNKIVSIKNFIVRQRDLEISEEEEINENNDWKPSYRSFCPLRRHKAMMLDERWVTATETTAPSSTTVSIISSSPPTSTTSTTTMTTPETIIKSKMIPTTTALTTTTTKSTATFTTTTATTTTTVTTTTTTTTTTSTVRPTTATTTTPKITTVSPTTTTTTTATTTTTRKSKPHHPITKRPTKKRPTHRTSPCEQDLQKIPEPSDCHKFLICIQKKGTNRFSLRRDECPDGKIFDKTRQNCGDPLNTECIIGRNNK